MNALNWPKTQTSLSLPLNKSYISPYMPSRKLAYTEMNYNNRKVKPLLIKVEIYFKFFFAEMYHNLHYDRIQYSLCNKRSV